MMIRIFSSLSSHLRSRRCLSGLSIALLSFCAFVAPPVFAESGIETVTRNLQETIPDLPIEEVAETAVPGIYEIISEGQIYYASEEGRYLFEGNLIDLNTRENLTDARKSGISMGLLGKMDESEMLIFEPEGNEADARTLTVFTDTSCPYCSRLHEEMDDLLAANIRVRYLLYPRAGMGSDAQKQLESVWCADDPQAAMTTAKQGGKVESKTCDNPIESHIALAQKVGLRGTPMIFVDSGEVVPGYQPAKALIDMVEGSEPL